ncbi:MAG: hypothetical protein WD876_01900, partial [Candidatus Pacearchaeota archaeon]
GKNGDMLVGDVIFIVLNVIFIAILIFFIVTKTNDAAIIEEKYAKQIALLIDSAKPGMRIHLNMEDAIEKAVDENQNIGAGLLDIVKIDNERNIVTVKLREKGGYSYSFFNEVNASAYLDTAPNEQEYILVINEIKK